MLGLLAVEEAVRRALVGDDLVLDARRPSSARSKAALSSAVMLVVVAGLQREDRAPASAGRSWIGPGWPLRSPSEP